MEVLISFSICSVLHMEVGWNVPHFFNIVLGLRVIDEEALEQALSAAVTCTILAAAGPQRSRVLATLYKVSI